MSAPVQIELIKKVVKDWALGDDCSSVDALIAIMEIMDFDPYAEQRQLPEIVATTHHAASGGS